MWSILPLALLNSAILVSTTSRQNPLIEGIDTSSSILPIFNTGNVVWTTEIGVGTPPLKFKAIILTASSDGFVGSANCSVPEYCYPHPLYNASKSKTSSGDGRSAYVNNGCFWTEGNVTTDSFHLGGIELKSQAFEAATTLDPYYWPREDIALHDSTLTLSRKIIYDDIESDIHAPSVFQNLVAQNLLNEDMFSLKLPRSPSDTGFLLLGGRGEDYDAAGVIRLPLLQGSETGLGYGIPVHSGGWEVEPVYLHFGSGEHQIYYDLHGYTAILTTSLPYLNLPATFVQWIWTHLGANLNGQIPCEDVNALLPNLTIALRGELGTTEEFVLTYQDYAEKIWEPYDWFAGEKSELCQLPFQGMDESEDALKYILLGPYFLRKYYTTFDAGASSIIRECCSLSRHRALLICLLVSLVD